MRKVNCKTKKPIQKPKGIQKPTIWQVLPYLYDFDKLTFQEPPAVDCRKKKPKKVKKAAHTRAPVFAGVGSMLQVMVRQSLVKIVVLLLIIGVNWLGLAAISGTVAYFFDSETSSGNFFGAAGVDFQLASPSDFVLEVSLDEDTERSVQVVDLESLPFQYQVHAENFVGDLCNVLHIQAFLKGNEEYSGPLTTYFAGPYNYGNPEDWDYSASLTSSDPVYYGTTCEFDFVFSGWQNEFPVVFSGFHDVEHIPSIIRAKLPQCDALSMGYWGNHEGCDKGNGESDWNLEVNALSVDYSSVFSSITGSEICSALWMPNCPSGNTVEAKLCRATAHTLADELNIVSGRLNANALVAGADNGDTAFDNLGLTSQSTIAEALDAVEAILANPLASKQQLVDAGFVAERIYTFYENENAEAPQCVYEWNEAEIQFLQLHSVQENGSQQNDSNEEEPEQQEEQIEKSEPNEEESTEDTSIGKESAEELTQETDEQENETEAQEEESVEEPKEEVEESEEDTVNETEENSKEVQQEQEEEQQFVEEENNTEVSEEQQNEEENTEIEQENTEDQGEEPQFVEEEDKKQEEPVAEEVQEEEKQNDTDADSPVVEEDEPVEDGKAEDTQTVEEVTETNTDEE